MEMTLGRIVSKSRRLLTPRQPAVPGAGKVRMAAALPAVALIGAFLISKEELEKAPRVIELYPVLTVYSKVRVLVPEPEV